ncbi:MAG: YgiQ family radical SAM protein [Pirellulales bacterium]|nr:YgiQ family radical SAM protein [Pirellulales bacterium]
MARQHAIKTTCPSDPLPMTAEEVTARGWDAVDVVFVTGDAYVDHPSFAMAILGRWLEAHGYRVAILSQPDWRSCEPWRMFGQPRVCFAISAGNMDSMVNHYTSNRKVRNDDAYSPGGQIGRRPDRATLAYCQRAREAYKSVPIVAGGVEASLRRIAHYDYWSDKVRRSILLDAKPDLLVFGMGEITLLEIVRRLAAGETVRDLRDLHGVAYRLGASETPPEDAVVLPSYEEVASDKRAFVEMTRLAHEQTNPHSARRLVQAHGRETVVVNRPAEPLSESQMDQIHGLPFTRQPHPSYGRQRIPAFDVVKDSIQILRGCPGGCTFCSIAAHQGRMVQSRSPQSVLDEIDRIAVSPGFGGTISDLGGPTANLYQMRGSNPDTCARCRRQSCLHPTVCPNFDTDHGPLIELMRAARKRPGVRRILIASGVRTDVAAADEGYIRELIEHHVGGRLKVAPEHTDPDVLQLMKKPPIEQFDAFAQQFGVVSSTAGKPQQLSLYFMAGHPGCDLRAMVDVALYLKRTGHRLEKVQEFLPGPFDAATCMYHTGIDPETGREVYVARGVRERRMQKALLLYDRPENDALVREALLTIGRTDLIGPGPECLIPDRPPRQPNKGKSSSSPTTRPGYRPHRRTARRKKR